MATSTIAIGGKQFPKPLVYAAGAATIGIVGYAWFTKSSSLETGEESELIPSGSGERVPPTTISSEGFFDTRAGIKTNAEWRDAAVEKLINLGLEGIAVSSAIGNFLARRPLSKTEADLVRQAIGAAGQPPEGGPWVVIEDATPAAVGLPAPSISGVQDWSRGTPGIKWSWTPVAGATGYDTELSEISTNQVIHTGVLGNADSSGNVKLASETAKNTWTSWIGLDAGSLYKLTVWARNSAGNKGTPGTGIAKASGAGTPNP